MSEERESTDIDAAVETADEPEAADPTSVEETGEGAGGQADADADEKVTEQAGASGRRSGRRWRWIAAAVLALGLIGAAYEGWLLYAHHQRTVAAAEALAAAEKYTLVLTGVDPGAIDKNFADVLDGATGEFKDMYAASSEQLRQLLIDNKAAAHGTVIDAAVKSASKNQVEVMLFIDQSVSNKASPQPKIDRSRIVMTMEKVHGRWLAAKVAMP